MIWHLIRYWITFIIPIFYKRLQGRNANFLKQKGPVIIAMNHPNAFTDAVAITYITYPLRVRYMARGDAFKAGLIAWLLEQIGIVPIYRIQDGGREGLKKNDEAYRRVNQLLKRNAKIIIFAEGLCVQEKRLRPLKKGVSRMVFSSYEHLKNLKDERLLVIPVGVNYSQADKFRSNLFYNVGAPILVKEYIEEYYENAAKANIKFLKMLEAEMKSLVIHINNPAYDNAVKHAEILLKNKWLEKNKLDEKNLYDDFKATELIVEKINSAEINQREDLDNFAEEAKKYFVNLKRYNVRDWIIDPSNNYKISNGHLFFRLIVLALGFPIYAFGLLGNYFPYTCTEKLSRKLIKGTVEFYASLVIAFGMFFFLTNYVLWFMFSYFYSPNIFWPLGICLFFVFCGWLGMHYHFFKLKTFGLWRAKNDATLTQNLRKQRDELIGTLNKFCAI
jgi:glycerol-3-phosphate O-acyltransferase / dihydroxyacetone phosphate acyltransferase